MSQEQNTPLCPACANGDHENSYITEQDYKCCCPCHRRTPVEHSAREFWEQTFKDSLSMILTQASLPQLPYAIETAAIRADIALKEWRGRWDQNYQRQVLDRNTWRA
jgi:hypothetical protein